jgi:hypothetical protein
MNVKACSNTFFSAWAWVGHGHSENLVKGTQAQRTESDPHRIIVSRSHQGEVTETVKKSLGNVEITPAGGAGMFLSSLVTLYLPFFILMHVRPVKIQIS